MNSFVCKVCHRDFSAARHLGRHMSTAHKQAENRCALCSKVFQTPAALGSHKLGVHGIAGSSTGSLAWRRKASKVAAVATTKLPRNGVVTIEEAIAALQIKIDAMTEVLEMLRAMLHG